MKKYYVGLSSTFHDSSIAILDEKGAVIFAEATERRLQFKRALNCPPDNFDLPRILKEYCEADSEFVVGTSWSDDYLAFTTRLERFGFFKESVLKDPIHQYPSRFLFSKSSIYSVMCLQQQFMKRVGIGFLIAVQTAFGHNRVTNHRFQHHLSHAAYACYSGPFKEATCVVVDGFGEFGSLSIYQYEDERIEPFYLHRGSESLGFFYEAVTQLCGFEWMHGEEWKVMGLAPYGKYDEQLYSLLRELCDFRDGKLVYAPLDVLQNNLNELDKLKRGKGSSPWDAVDMAYNGQLVYSEVMYKMLGWLKKELPYDDLIICGGCGLNSSFNGTVIEKTAYKNLSVPSAPADDGNAIGAAFLALKKEKPDFKIGQRGFLSPYLGSKMATRSLKNLQELSGIRNMKKLPLTIHKETAKLLAEGKLVGWIQGRAEFGPRSLGNRSILADPRPADMKNKINAKVKFREEFRPFAPSILDEYGAEYFENYQETPYMERTLRFREEVRDKVPAVVHANQTGRLQSVKKEWNPSYYKLIKAFYNLTGVPILLNTSLNVMGKPIVHSVEDAISLFYTTGLDALVIGDYLIEK